MSSDVAAVMKRAANDWRQEVERKGREGKGRKEGTGREGSGDRKSVV